MTDLWKVLAGATIFALGMNFLEKAMHALSGRNFKLFLKKNTYHVPSAIGIGALASGVLQSSSVVNLLILSLVGSGAIPLRNALAVTLGSNLGTTLNTWILSSIGFRFDIGTIAFPAVAIAGLARMFLKETSTVYHFFSCLLGLGFIMLGIEFIKTGTSVFVGGVNLSEFGSYPVIIYFLLGALITALLQTSAATVAIVLGTLHSHGIGLYAATAVVLGSEVGTTFKFLFISYGREPSLRRVAFGNFLFNLANALLVLMLLIPINSLITDTFSIKDPLTALAFFQTFINIVAIVLCAPFLDSLAKFLERRFIDTHRSTRYIGKVPLPDTELAINALKNEAVYFLQTVLQFAANMLTYDKKLPVLDISSHFLSQTLAEQYRFIKQLNGDIYKYYISILQAQTLPAQTEELDHLISSVRDGIFTAKSLHDVERDIIQLSTSANEKKYGFYLRSKEAANALLVHFAYLTQVSDQKDNVRQLVDAYRMAQSSFGNILHTGQLQTNGLSEIEVSTLINLNRELSNAFYSIISSFTNLLLDNEERENMDKLIGG